jgi:hypothetical protein
MNNRLPTGNSPSALRWKAYIKPIWIALYLIALTAILYAAFSHWGYDDPFITYRYAHNLTQGEGLVYNPGMRVLSTTTPLFALLLAGLSTTGIPIPHLAVLVGAFSLGLGGLFLWDLARSWEAPLVGWVGLTLYPTFALLLTTLSSETPLYLAFILGAFASYARGRYVMSAILSALAVLARADGALVPLILGVDYLVRMRRPIPWRSLAAFVVVAGPWFLFAWSYYGSPIPVTLSAKQHQGALQGSQLFAPGFVSLVKAYASNWLNWLEASLALLGLLFLIWRGRRWGLPLAWTGLYFGAYTALGVTRYFWYYAPLAPGFVILIGLGLNALAGPGKPKSGENSSNESRGPSLVARLYSLFSLTLAVALLATLAIRQGLNMAEIREQVDPRLSIYRAVGQWLHENTPPQASVGTLEVGIIGYYAQRIMVDFAGLIQPDIAAHLTAESDYQQAAVWAVDHYHPDYLVLHEGIFPQLRSHYVDEQCEPIRTFSGQNFAYNTDMQIFACQGETPGS